MSEVLVEEKKEAAVASEATKKAPEIQSAAEIKKLLQGALASGYTPVYINSLGKEIGFKEISVQQQKILSRTMIGNENRKDIIYDAQCATINETCLEEGFDIYNFTELERLKLLIALYQANMFNNDVQFTCKECGFENKYKLNFDNVLHKLDAISIEPTKFHYDSRTLSYDFTCAYPKVQLVSKFHKQYFAKHSGTSKREVKINDTMSNMEYINLFIAGLEVFKDGKSIQKIDFSQMKPADIEDILQVLPQDVLYTDNGVLQYITREYLQKLNDAFDKHVCQRCHTVQEDERTNQVEGFL